MSDPERSPAVPPLAPPVVAGAGQGEGVPTGAVPRFLARIPWWVVFALLLLFLGTLGAVLVTYAQSQA